MGEKGLRQILGILGAGPRSPHERVQRIPVGAAELFERFQPLSGVGRMGDQNDAPVRRGKYPGLPLRVAFRRFRPHSSI